MEEYYKILIPLSYSVMIFLINILIYNTLLLKNIQNINEIIKTFIHAFVTFILYAIIYEEFVGISGNIIIVIFFGSLGSYLLYLFLSAFEAIIQRKGFNNKSFLQGMYFTISNIIGITLLLFFISIHTSNTELPTERIKEYRERVKKRDRRGNQGKKSPSLYEKPIHNLDSDITFNESDIKSMTESKQHRSFLDPDSDE